MKNKDDIEIRVGQVWEDKHGDSDENKVIALTSKGFPVVEFSNSGVGETIIGNHLEESLHRLLSCPVLADMTHWDIVTEEQKRDYNKPKEAQLFYSVWRECDGQQSWASSLYRVPRNFDWEPYRKDEAYGLPMDHVEKVRQQDRKDVDYCNTCNTCNTCGAYGHDEQYIDGGTNCKGCDGDKFEPKPAIEPLDMHGYVVCDNSHSMDKAFKKIEEKINEIINHLNKEQG